MEKLFLFVLEGSYRHRWELPVLHSPPKNKAVGRCHRTLDRPRRNNKTRRDETVILTSSSPPGVLPRGGADRRDIEFRRRVEFKIAIGKIASQRFTLESSDVLSVSVYLLSPRLNFRWGNKTSLLSPTKRGSNCPWQPG